MCLKSRQLGLVTVMNKGKFTLHRQMPTDADNLHPFTDIPQPDKHLKNTHWSKVMIWSRQSGSCRLKVQPIGLKKTGKAIGAGRESLHKDVQPLRIRNLLLWPPTPSLFPLLLLGQSNTFVCSS